MLRVAQSTSGWKTQPLMHPDLDTLDQYVGAEVHSPQLVGAQ